MSLKLECDIVNATTVLPVLGMLKSSVHCVNGVEKIFTVTGFGWIRNATHTMGKG